MASTKEHAVGDNSHERILYRFQQSVDELTLTVPLACRTRASRVAVRTNRTSLSISVLFPDSETWHSVLFGQLCGAIKAEETLWTLHSASDGSDTSELHIQLTKAERGKTWPGVLVGSESHSAADEDSRKMILQRFQEEHPGFDFSNAQLNGQPPDPSQFMGGISSTPG
jgi:hypothetical protein